MSTSAGVCIKTDVDTALWIAQQLHELDEKTNAHGLGVACIPTIFRDGKTFVIDAQTHWSYDGTNGRIFVRELESWLKTWPKVKIKRRWFK